MNKFRLDLRFWTMLALLAVSAFVVNWMAHRGEIATERRQLAELPTSLGTWQQRGSAIKFDEGVEQILRASDYTMREYSAPDGRIANIYVGYYASQRTGATYHSPQNCLPGAGWVLKEPQTTTITTADGRSFEANQYFIENGVYKEVMIYWYQGRGHFEASEYRDKVNTVIDSITMRRTDGAMVRVMTSIGADQAASVASAKELSARLAEQLTPYIPE